MPTKKKIKRPSTKPRGRPFPKGVSGNPTGKPKAPPPDAPPVLAVEDAGRQECLDWLAREGIEIAVPWQLDLSKAPKEPEKNVPYRLAVWDKAAHEMKFRFEVLRRCVGSGAGDADALEWYTDTFVWQHNPDHVGSEVGPFITRDYQKRAAQETLAVVFGDRKPGEARGDVLWEKSRELGATWWALDICDKICLFHPWKTILAISHSEQAVDRAGDPGTLFWKVKFIHERLPPWLLRGARKRKMGFWYPHTNSAINGAASTGRSGVGGRDTLVLLDEFSKQRDAAAIWGQTASTGPRLVIGTHYGVGTHFYDLTVDEDIPKVVMHWSEHPDMRRGLYRVTDGKLEVLDKTFEFPPGYPFILDGSPTGGPHHGLRSAWYDAECKRRKSQRDVRQHLDIDAAGSESQVFEAIIIRRLRQKAQVPVWVGNLVDGVLRPNPQGSLRLWVQPDILGRLPPGDYGVGCDISQGVGSSPSCAAAYDAGLCQRVAELVTAKMDPKEFAVVVAALGRLLRSQSGREALLGWETNGPGTSFGQKALLLGYTRVYYPDVLVPEMGAPRRSKTPGWAAKPDSKQNLIEEYRWAVQSEALAELSDETLAETLKYRYGKDGRPEHPKQKATRDTTDPSGTTVNHGDRVTAAAIGWKMVLELGAGRTREADPEQPAPAGSWLWRRQQGEIRDREGDGWT